MTVVVRATMSLSRMFSSVFSSAVTSAQPRATLSLRVRKLERLLLPGVRVRLYVTQRGAVGKYTKIRFRRGKAPVRTDRCLIPGAPAPVQCPAA